MTRRSKPLIYGHRGGNAGRPNSVEAIRLAAEAGADGVEIDVQLSGGRLIAQHDPVVDEANFDGDELDDVLAAVRESGLRLLVDFKSTGHPAAEAAALAEALAGAGDRVIVSSFDLPFLEAFDSVAPAVRAMPIISMRQNFPGLPDLDRWDGVSVLAAALIVHPLLTWRIRRSDCKLFAWFGATEWPMIKGAVKRLGAHALILKRTSQH